MTLKEDCRDCDWSETWEGGSAAEDPAFTAYCPECLEVTVMENIGHLVK